MSFSVHFISKNRTNYYICLTGINCLNFLLKDLSFLHIFDYKIYVIFELIFRKGKDIIIENINFMEGIGNKPLNEKYTPDFITVLGPKDIFVFGSNLAGAHAGGAARLAHQKFGAEWGRGVGLQGNSYAIPTMQGGRETIRPYVDEFIEFAKSHPELTFYVTKIGCGIAGFSEEEIAPLFHKAIGISNIRLPKDFVEVYNRDEN